DEVSAIGRERRLDDAADRSAVVRRDGYVDADGAVSGGDVELPPNADDREAGLQQEAVADEVLFRRAVQTERRRVPAVDDVHEGNAVADAILRPQREDVRAELDPAGGGGRRLADVGDDGVPGILRIDGEIRLPGDLLVA